MRLNDELLQKESASLQNLGYVLPSYDRAAMRRKTKEAPTWIHFGAGNIFRAFQADIAESLLNKGLSETGVIAGAGIDEETFLKMYRPQDDLCALAVLKADGTVDKKIIGSIGESVLLNFREEAEYTRLKQIFASPSLQIVSLSITEKGYALKDMHGRYLPSVEHDLESTPEQAESYLGKLTAMLYWRYEHGASPIALVSMDNCSHNGDRLREAVLTYAESWSRERLCHSGFACYLKDPGRVSFPWTMIDKITPRADQSAADLFEKDGFEGFEPTPWAPFVNAEETGYLVIEDHFPNGRPLLEKAGVMLGTRETVEKCERMKVCTCLNPLHTALAVFGCLLGYTRIYQEMQDPDLVRLIERIGYTEGLPVVENPGVLNPKEFLDTVLQVRLPNPFMPDAPQRIAMDTSQKLSVRYGETIKNYIREGRSLEDLKMIPLVFAGWIRYLMGIDDNGEVFERSSDPLLETAGAYAAKLHLGEENPQLKETVLPLLKNTAVFGVDLEETGLADRTVSCLEELLEGTGAVRRTLHKYAMEEK